MGTGATVPICIQEQNVAVVRQLKPGDIFRVDFYRNQYRDYRLIYANDCRAYVEPIKKERDALDDDEEHRTGKINISPLTECTMLVDAELEEFMSTPTTTGKKKGTIVTTVTQTKTPKSNNLPKKTRGDRELKPFKMERPVRENTIRAKMIEAIMQAGGTVSISKFAKKFEQVESLFVAHVHEMHKCHGYGYAIVGDNLKLTAPVGGVLKGKPAKLPKADKKKADRKPGNQPVRDALADDEEDDFLS